MKIIRISLALLMVRKSIYGNKINILKLNHKICNFLLIIELFTSKINYNITTITKIILRSILYSTAFSKT